MWVICNEEDRQGFAVETGKLSDPSCLDRLVTNRVTLAVAIVQSVLVFVALQNVRLSLVSHDQVETEVAPLGRVGVRRETNDGRVHLALAFNYNLDEKMRSPTWVVQ